MRKYFIDNVRWIAVLFLFPYHTARIFDDIQPFYIKGVGLRAATDFVLGCTPWFMPILFVVAGISTRYAMQKRSSKEYALERLSKLLVPLVFGILLLIPVQTYVAERFHNAYAGSYWNQYILFFTKPSDFSGYSGGFTPGQLWFVFDLFIISLAALPLIHVIKKKNIKWPNISGFFVIPLCAITFALSYVLEIGGKSTGEYFVLFFLGYFVLAEEPVQAFTERYRILLAVIGGTLLIYTVMFQTSLSAGALNRGIMILTSWICILAILGMGRHYLNFRNKWSGYLSASSFAFYLFHQSLIVLIGFYILQTPFRSGLQYLLIISGGVIGSVFMYEFCKRFKVLRVMFAIKR